MWGLDVARYGDDRTALVHSQAPRVEKVESWRGLDTMQTAGRVKLAYDEAATDDKPTNIVIDVIGIGAGVVDRLRELGLPVRASTWPRRRQSGRNSTGSGMRCIGRAASGSRA
jgi:phage terminase large subunit